MPADELPKLNDLSEVNEQLTEGIESCRSVIANYKSLLSNEPGETASAEVSGDSSVTEPPTFNQM